mgnify:CR=1 FL=1
MDVLKKPFIIGYDKEEKIVFIVGEDEATIDALAANGYRVYRLRSVPRILYGYEKYRERRRPLVGGLSIGTGMATGTAGLIVYYGESPAILTNAHVVTMTPWLDTPNPEPIIQPGIADGGKKPEDEIGRYWYHVRIELEKNSECPIAKIWSGIYNFIAEKLGRRTRIIPLTGVDEKHANKVDVGIVKINEGIEAEPYKILMPDGTLYEPETIYGLLFAGSEEDNITIVCKIQNIKHYLPALQIPENNMGTVKTGDKIAKAGRTTGYTIGEVIATNATIKVYYGAGFAVFTDVIVAKGIDEIISSPGDSGSLVFKPKE